VDKQKILRRNRGGRRGRFLGGRRKGKESGFFGNGIADQSLANKRGQGEKILEDGLGVFGATDESITLFLEEGGKPLSRTLNQGDVLRGKSSSPELKTAVGEKKISGDSQNRKEKESRPRNTS